MNGKNVKAWHLDTPDIFPAYGNLNRFSLRTQNLELKKNSRKNLKESVAVLKTILQKVYLRDSTRVSSSKALCWAQPPTLPLGRSCLYWAFPGLHKAFSYYIRATGANAFDAHTLRGMKMMNIKTELKIRDRQREILIKIFSVSDHGTLVKMQQRRNYS